MPRLLTLPNSRLPLPPEAFPSPWHGAPSAIALAAREALEDLEPKEASTFQGRRGILLARSADSDETLVLATDEPFQESPAEDFVEVSVEGFEGCKGTEGKTLRLPRADTLAGICPDEAFEGAARSITLTTLAGEAVNLFAFAQSERAKKPAKIARGGAAGLNLTLAHWNRALLDAPQAPLVANLARLGEMRLADPTLRPLASLEWWYGAMPVCDVKWPGQILSPRTTLKPLAERLLDGIAFESDPRVTSPVTLALRPRILMDAPDFVAIEKPSGLLSVPGTGGLPDALTLTSAMVGVPLTAVHRLDMDTSGILLYAKTPEGTRRLMAAFREGLVEKRYRALLLGNLEADAGRIDLPITTHPLDRLRQIIAAGGRPSTTLWRRIATNGHRTLVDFLPQTGRTHQLRIHAAHPLGLGAPIAGDPYYSAAGLLVDAPETPLCLHAAEITFPDPADPTSEKRIRLETLEPFGI